MKDSVTIIHSIVYNQGGNSTKVHIYSETSLIRHSVGPEYIVGLNGCWIMECLLPYLCIVTVPHIMVGLERMLDYRGVGLARFHCTHIRTYVPAFRVTVYTYVSTYTRT